MAVFNGNSFWALTSEPTTKTGYPAEIALHIRESKQSGPKVAKALRDMYEQGKEGNEKYSPENCREIAQKYLNYAKHNHRNLNLMDVRKFVTEMNNTIQQRVEDTEDRTMRPG